MAFGTALLHLPASELHLSAISEQNLLKVFLAEHLVLVERHARAREAVLRLWLRNTGDNRAAVCHLVDSTLEMDTICVLKLSEYLRDGTI